MTGRRRRDLEHSGGVLRSRVVYGAEGCAGLAAEQGGSFFAILDQGTIAEIAQVEGDDVPGGRAVYEFDTAAARDAFLDERCRGMHRLDERQGDRAVGSVESAAPTDVAITVDAEVVAGVDGCKQGWVAVLLRAGRFQRTVVETNFDRLLPLLSDACIVGVDIPIGLAPSTFRDCDAEARQRLGSQKARVFRVPPAEAYLHRDTYEAGVRRCRELTGEGFSQQAFALRTKIVEVGRHAADPRVYEVHPEISFLEMAVGASLPGKKTWAGQSRRRRLLEQAGIALPDEVGPADQVAPDDLLDAAAAAWTAQRIAAGRALRIPAGGQQRGDGGRPIAIWV